MTSLHDLSRNRTLGLLVGKGFFNSDYKSNAVILEVVMSILAFIPARGGSKSIPLKNIKMFYGKPLIYFNITKIKCRQNNCCYRFQSN